MAQAYLPIVVLEDCVRGVLDDRHFVRFVLIVRIRDRGHRRVENSPTPVCVVLPKSCRPLEPEERVSNRGERGPSKQGSKSDVGSVQSFGFRLHPIILQKVTCFKAQHQATRRFLAVALGDESFRHNRIVEKGHGGETERSGEVRCAL